MNISIITPSFPYPNAGSLPRIERSSENFALNLKKLGHTVKIIATYWNGGKRWDDYKGIPILRILDSKSLIGKLGSIFQMNFITFGLNLIRKKNFRFYIDSDAIILPLALGFTRFFKIKKISTISIFHHYEIPKSLLSYLYFPFYNYLAKRQFKTHINIIVRSNSAKKDLLKYYKLKNVRIKIIPDGVDLDKFSPNNKGLWIKRKYGKNILLYVGPFLKRRRIPILLKAMLNVIKKIPDTHLILIGKGPSLKHCKNLSKSLGIQQNLSFLGFIKDKILLKYYASSDLFIFPSELEGQGQVILESMACGTPVICAYILPMSEIIENGGITYKLNDSIDLSKNIINLLNNPKYLAELRKNALNIVKKYNLIQITEKYIDHVKKIKNQFKS